MSQDALFIYIYNFSTLKNLSQQNNTKNDIQIKQKTDKPGIDIYILPNTKNQRVDIPVIVSKAGITDITYNDFYVGENADVLIVAGELNKLENLSNKASEVIDVGHALQDALEE